MSKMLQLPNGDLWTAPERDASGEIVPRPDNIAAVPLNSPKPMSADVQAILMAELTKQAGNSAPISPMVGMTSK